VEVLAAVTEGAGDRAGTELAATAGFAWAAAFTVEVLAAGMPLLNILCLGLAVLTGSPC
jgi:hypothetical protein